MSRIESAQRRINATEDTGLADLFEIENLERKEEDPSWAYLIAKLASGIMRGVRSLFGK